MTKKLRFLTIFAVMLVAAASLAATPLAPVTQTDTPAPSQVVVAGTLQNAVGCGGEWNTQCEQSELFYSPKDNLWVGTFALPAGDYEYKVALNGSWDENYGLNGESYGPNIPLSNAEEGNVFFWYDHKTNFVGDSVNYLVANVAGDFQSELGCPGDWAPDCLRSMLMDVDGDGIYTFATALIPAGDYEAKVAYDQSWTVNYGAEGVADGSNIAFSVPDGVATIFRWDPDALTLTIETSEDTTGLITSLEDLPQPDTSGLPPPVLAKPNTVNIPGTIQSVLGCPGDWQPDCAATYLEFNPESDVWFSTFDIPAGSYEYKVAANDSWDINFGVNSERGGANIPLEIAVDSTITFYFDHKTATIANSYENDIYVVVGDFQQLLGCANNDDPACLRSWLQDPDNDGLYTYLTDKLLPGSYQIALSTNGETAEPFTLDVPAGENVLTNFFYDVNSGELTVLASEVRAPEGSIKEQTAYFVDSDTILWDIPVDETETYLFHFDRGGNTFRLGFEGISGGESFPIIYDPNGASDEVKAKFPHLANLPAFKVDRGNRFDVRLGIKGLVAVTAQDVDGNTRYAAGLQLPGLLDDMYPYDGPLGVTWDGDIPTLRVWAPTAWMTTLHLFDTSDPAAEPVQSIQMKPDTKVGVWSAVGEVDWKGMYYLYEVRVYAPSEGRVVNNFVTDPYAFSLSKNSTRSQIVDLADPALAPEGWADVVKTGIAAPEDIVIYELHVRDFSANDATVPDEMKGTFKAFTLKDSSGMTHLANLADAGLTHLHLLPAFDIATINEEKSEWQSPDFDELSAFPPDSDQQQNVVNLLRDADAFNWGYDPYHYTVPEGSYSTDPDGPTRIVEFREMVQSLNDLGLYVVMDVVYNHTNAAGQAEKSVLDKIVPGYYHRLNGKGQVERSTCCANTATEHNMMRKLMIDSVLTWATEYKVDAFRFDLMGHHMKADMLALRAALDALTLEKDGVDGKAIYLYGEGWNFGEVADNARGVNATQFNMAETGIGTFNDRLRDAVRGGSPFGGHLEQGFATGLCYDPNDFNQGSETTVCERALLFADITRATLAGNLQEYPFTNYKGVNTRGLGVDYNGSGAGYTTDPQENIVYVSKHDNETLFDVVQFKVPLDTSMADRVRTQNVALDLVMYSQGVPFFHAGSDMLRTKSLDRDSYNSGDWFNRLDFTYETNDWGMGLPIADKNQDNWGIMKPLLAADGLAPESEDILANVAHFQDALRIRQSSVLFRLRTEQDVIDRVAFHNTGPDQIPGVIVMSISDMVGENLDPEHDMIVTLFNAND